MYTVCDILAHVFVYSSAMRRRDLVDEDTYDVWQIHVRGDVDFVGQGHAKFF